MKNDAVTTTYTVDPSPALENRLLAIVESKRWLIGQMVGKPLPVVEDTPDPGLTYAQIKAIASGETSQ